MSHQRRSSLGLKAVQNHLELLDRGANGQLAGEWICIQPRPVTVPLWGVVLCRTSIEGPVQLSLNWQGKRYDWESVNEHSLEWPCMVSYLDRKYSRIWKLCLRRACCDRMWPFTSDASGWTVASIHGHWNYECQPGRTAFISMNVLSWYSEGTAHIFWLKCTITYAIPGHSEWKEQDHLLSCYAPLSYGMQTGSKGNAA